MKRRFLDMLAWQIVPLILLSLIGSIFSKLFDGTENEALALVIFIGICAVVVIVSSWFFNNKIITHTVKVKLFGDEANIDLIDDMHGDLIDLRAAEDVEMKAFEYKLIPLGVAMKLPMGYKANVYPRSSTYKNFGIILANSVGQIDNGYQGDRDVWFFPAIALRDTVIHKGDRICQFEIVPTMPPVKFEIVESLSEKSRGGIGSTGTR